MVAISPANDAPTSDTPTPALAIRAVSIVKPLIAFSPFDIRPARILRPIRLPSCAGATPVERIRARMWMKIGHENKWPGSVRIGRHVGAVPGDLRSIVGPALTGASSAARGGNDQHMIRNDVPQPPERRTGCEPAHPLAWHPTTRDGR